MGLFWFGVILTQGYFDTGLFRMGLFWHGVIMVWGYCGGVILVGLFQWGYFGEVISVGSFWFEVISFIL